MCNFSGDNPIIVSKDGEVACGVESAQALVWDGAT